jgi:hypothetical protein
MSKQTDPRPTAKIYAFPTPKRVAPAGHLPDAASLPMIECGRGWYHQEAIDEANRLGDRRRHQH